LHSSGVDLSAEDKMNPRGLTCLARGLCTVLVAFVLSGQSPIQERRFLYVAVPGIRNEVEHGGVGVLVFDIDNGHKFVRRIPTWTAAEGQEAEDVKGIAANAGTGRLYVSTTKRLAAFDLLTDKKVWEKTYDGDCCDRMAVSPDGQTLYVPSFDKPKWYVVNAATGDVIKTLDVPGRSHNTIYSADGTHAYLAALSSPTLSIAETKTHSVVKTVGPFSNAIRPFTINGKQTICFVNVNALLGFEVGDLQTGKVLHEVAVEGYKTGKVKRHGCPSHGIALTPDETEIWISDGFNSRLHIFDATAMPPKQKTSIPVRDQPGWITFSIDGQRAYPSTGEVIDIRTKKILTTLEDEIGRHVQSEKLLEIIFVSGKPVRAGDQFAMGTKR
jgi:DNA-binding beta-propeller fold protein YncE